MKASQRRRRAAALVRKIRPGLLNGEDADAAVRALEAGNDLAAAYRLGAAAAIETVVAGQPDVAYLVHVAWMLLAGELDEATAAKVEAEFEARRPRD